MVIRFLRLYWLALLFLAISLACAVAYHLIGASLDEEGFLHEPFALVPLSYVFGVLSVVTAAYITGKLLWHRRRS